MIGFHCFVLGGENIYNWT